MVTLDVSDGDADPAGTLPACIVVTHSSGGLTEGQRVDAPRDGLSIGTTREDVVVEAKGLPAHVELGWTRIGGGRWEARSTRRVWVNGRLAGNVVVSSGDDLRIADTFFRFICGADLEQKFYETVYQLTITAFSSGLGNRRAFDEAFRIVVSRSTTTGSTLLVAVGSRGWVTDSGQKCGASRGYARPMVERTSGREQHSPLGGCRGGGPRNGPPRRCGDRPRTPSNSVRLTYRRSAATTSSKPTDEQEVMTAKTLHVRTRCG